MKKKKLLGFVINYCEFFKYNDSFGSFKNKNKNKKKPYRARHIFC